jgi:phosphonate transport system ATP-binding protein
VNLHQPDLVRRHFARIVGIRDGRVAFDLPVAEVDDARLASFFTVRTAPRAATGEAEPLREPGVRRPACRPMES